MMLYSTFSNCTSIEGTASRKTSFQRFPLPKPAPFKRSSPFFVPLPVIIHTPPEKVKYFYLFFKKLIKNLKKGYHYISTR